MARDWRTLKLEILAETKQFADGMNKSEKQVESLGGQIADFGKKAALAFAAVGAAVGAFAYAAVKAAAEDEAAQKKLEDTIRATTNATDDQVKIVQRYIDTTSIAIGVTDDELRPAFERLIRSTNSVSEAQKLLNLALDLSAATQKPLEEVSNALARAYDGNFTALSRLGTGIDAGILKTKDFNKVYDNLATTFGNFAEKQAETTKVKFDRIRIAVDEAKESIGAALLPVVQQLSDFILTSVVPAIDSFVGGLTQSGDQSKFASVGAYNFGEQVRGIIKFLVDAKDELVKIGEIIAIVFVASKVYSFVVALEKVIATLVALRTAAAAAGVATAFATGGTSVVAAGAAVAAAGLTAYGLGQLGGGAAPTPTVPTVPSAGYIADKYMTPQTNITINGAIDPEGTARQVAKYVNGSSARVSAVLAGTSVRGD